MSGEETETDKHIGVVSTVMQTLHQSVMVGDNRELSTKMKLSIYPPIYVPTLTSDQ